MFLTNLKKSVIVILFLYSTVSAHASTVPEDQIDSLRGYYFTAARSGNLEVMSEFFKAGISPDLRNPQSYTPLMLAAYNGHGDLVDMLLQEGANPCLKDKRGNTALMAAVFKVELAIVKTLIETDCNLEEKNNAGQTVQDFASMFGQSESIKLIRSRSE